MTALAERIGQEALSLSEAERLALAQLLFESVDAPADPDAESAWDEELKKRLHRLQTGQAKGRPASEVLSEIRAELGR